MEIDEGLHVAGFDLDDNEDNGDDEECLDDEGAFRHHVLHAFGERLRHEVEKVAEQHQRGDSGV